MPKKKESAQELATKADVQVVDKKVQALDHKVNNIAIKVVTIESDLKEVKENMLTKADKNEIMNSMDNLMGEVKGLGRNNLDRFGDPGLRTFLGARSEHSLDYVSDEQRRNGPKMGLPEGAGRFCPSLSRVLATVVKTTLAAGRFNLGQNQLSQTVKVIPSQALRP